VKPFIKCVNYNHLMPTRYALDVELKSLVTTDVVSGGNLPAKQNVRKEVKKLFEEKCAPPREQTPLGCLPLLRRCWRPRRRRPRMHGSRRWTSGSNAAAPGAGTTPH
jgi:hypothetical protein